MGVFMKELSLFYEALSQGQQPLLPELEIQYADYTMWQREWLQGEVLAQELDYWKNKLAGELPVLQLPTDRPRPAVQTFNGKQENMTLSPTLSKAVRELGKNEGTTLYMTMLAAFKTLLYRYTQQEDVLVGTAIANRNRNEIEDLIGFFVNTLVLRSDLSGDPTFQEVLGQVRRTTLEAYAHPDLPFEKLVEALQPDRNLSHSPLFQVMLILTNEQTNSSIDLYDLETASLDYNN